MTGTTGERILQGKGPEGVGVGRNKRRRTTRESGERVGWNGRSLYHEEA